jgi:hypothetical protein
MSSKSKGFAASAGEMDTATFRPSIASETNDIYSALVGLGDEIDALETCLRPVLEETNEGLAGLEDPELPPAVMRLRGLLRSVQAYHRRLESIRLRLAVE